MKFLRCVAGYTHVHMKNNAHIHMGLQMFSSIGKLEEYRNKYYEHVCRVNSEQAYLKVLNYTLRGRRHWGVSDEADTMDFLEETEDIH